MKGNIWKKAIKFGVIVLSMGIIGTTSVPNNSFKLASAKSKKIKLKVDGKIDELNNITLTANSNRWELLKIGHYSC
ncbi:hypothetical protein ATW97_03925 [Oenococcus oeni]|uniref:Uncharacterized protein n=1 Tax=Oenococcus oeni TaxID=1247 RepID=A0AAJ2P1G4_OENOE|nr:hypothetical protein [Oenococcus oeni]KDE87040.1 hypothetical protein EL27_00755 [Oenococcus oeni]KEP88380.1 hypothetical protein X279_01775 [Oenococcus oeni IOEB_0501]KGH71786.1 hypothetical protein X280_07515 [Oenococcus oeni IOEB_0502]KGH74967.1 hypothetical protein X285_09000 [Oenococcus oeni IOEB_9304]KGH84412.1 hypothetical protein X292_08970 [Oenococcus oeni IOEB_C28]